MDTLTQENISILALVAVLLPLLTFFTILFIPGKASRGGYIAIASIAASLIISIFLFSVVWNRQPVHEQFEWFTIAGRTFQAGVLLNNLSVLMMVLVSGIALLVHVYSTKYMQGDPYLYRYWAYLGLFCFSMLLLVIADNLLLMYMAWELVGFSSYLLIGFWFTRHTAVLANRKAFIMNRLGDLGFLTGIMIVLNQFNTLDITRLFGDNGLVMSAVVENGFWINGTSSMPDVWLNVAGLAFFLGAVAKSAQFPLHTWLPDAMEGPTSVSSLIHAATMVAAGVFLLARINPLFSADVLTVIAIIGAFTAFMSASIALVQNDIKRILAFSTISQLGFMMLAMGVGAQSSAIFHLVTHAFFKCLLFLAAGAVIHEMAHLRDKNNLQFDTQDIRLMGGLRKRMPVTFVCMLVASLALAGLPLTSGYLSKDAILIQSFEWAEGRNGLSKLIPYSALITSWFTAFYISRLIFKVFFGELRIEKQFAMKFSVHEAPAAMKNVLVVLAVLCLFPVFSSHPLLFEDAWLLKGLPVADTMTRVNAFHTIVPAAVNIMAVLLIYLAYQWYGRQKKMPAFSNTALFRFAGNQWFFDKVYDSVIVDGIVLISRGIYFFDKVVVDGVVNLVGRAGVVLSYLSRWTDRNIIDGIVNGAAYLTGQTGRFFRHFQTGRLQHYFVTMLLILLGFFIFKYYSGAI
ncbi:NADH-quinone oxidoreductase subunit L [Arcticibacter tournemirensis]